jgi:hypothetical protein
VLYRLIALAMGFKEDFFADKVSQSSAGDAQP